MCFPNLVLMLCCVFACLLRDCHISTFGWLSHMLSVLVALLVFFKFYLFIYLWLCWVFISVRGLSLLAASGGHSSSRCAGLSLSQPLLLRSTGSRRAGSAIVAHGPSRSAACGIFPDQGSNPCPLNWQADSQPQRHQGSPQLLCFYNTILLLLCERQVRKFSLVFMPSLLQIGRASCRERV